MVSQDADPKAIRSLASLSVEQLPVPLKGTWSGERGKSSFTLSDDANVGYWSQGERKEVSGACVRRRMLSEYGVDSVRYDSGEPVFSPFADRELGSVELGSFSTDRGVNFRNANAAKAAELGWKAADVERLMGERGLTWHECGDRRTLLAVPTYIHAAFPHGGGVAVEKSVEAIRSKLSKRFPNGFVLARQEGTLTVAKDDLDRAIDGMRKSYREERRRLAGERRTPPDGEPGGPYVGTRELAEEYGVSAGTIRRWCRSGRMPGAEKDASGRWRVATTE